LGGAIIDTDAGESVGIVEDGAEIEGKTKRCAQS
jgi:hypothetical protein